MRDEQFNKIESRAYQLGFDAIGWTGNLKPLHADYLKDWVDGKKYGDMVWFERTLSSRLDPQVIDQNIQSAIVLLTSYKHTPEWIPSHAKRNAGTTGLPVGLPRIKLARYAYGCDYHIWIRERQNQLIHFIQTEIESSFIGYSTIDSGPVLERDLAVKAGLGWIGKNTCLIHPKLGSFVFISVILTNVVLKGGDVLPNVSTRMPGCGTCTKCLTVCPTQALKPYQLDQQQCRAYQANAKKGERDKELWNNFGESILGCDVCQEVCPWNEKAPGTRQKDWLETFEKYRIADLRELLHMTESDYRARFEGSVLDRNYIDQMRNVFLVIAFQKRVDLLDDVLRWKEKHADLNMAECAYCLERLK